MDGAYWTRKNPIAKCAVAAMRAGYSVFAVQNGGWCAASATAVKTFNKYGKSAACKSDGEGGPWANQVYVINGKTLFRCRSLSHLKETQAIVCYQLPSLCFQPSRKCNFFLANNFFSLQSKKDNYDVELTLGNYKK